jgi:LacI family transcriptional regulator
MRKPLETPSIKGIARQLGVSIGTVDRALHGKPDVSPVTQARVQTLARELGYAPNLAARYLRSRRRCRIVVHLPRKSTPFWRALRDGIREGAAAIGPTLDIEVATYGRPGDGSDLALLDAALAGEADGVILAPGDAAAAAPYLAEAHRRGIPVACVVNGAPGQPRLLSVFVDPFCVGSVAGELLAMSLPVGAQVAYVTDSLARSGDVDRLRGLAEGLATLGNGRTIGATFEVHPGEDVYRRALAWLRGHPHLRGLYVSAANALPVIRAASHARGHAPLIVVADDLFPELGDAIRAGRLAATVYQRPRTQGRVALRSLYEYLQNRQRPGDQRIVPYVVLRGNVDVVLARMSGGAGACEAVADPRPALAFR